MSVRPLFAVYVHDVYRFKLNSIDTDSLSRDGNRRTRDGFKFGAT